jgi:hypothetical protein
MVIKMLLNNDIYIYIYIYIYLFIFLIFFLIFFLVQIILNFQKEINVIMYIIEFFEKVNLNHVI